MKTALHLTAIVLGIFLFSNAVQARPLSISPFSAIATDSTDQWILKSETNGVKAYYRVSTCGLFPVVLIKFVNTNTSAVTINWDNQIIIAGNSTPVQEGSGTIIVQPGEISVSSCAIADFPQLIVRSAKLMPADSIEGFSFQNLQITQ